MPGQWGGVRWGIAREPTSAKRRLDVRELVREPTEALGCGVFRQGFHEWPDGCALEYVLALAAERGLGALGIASMGGAPECEVPLEPMPCSFGGVRWWARCPRCVRRVAVLWGPPFWCRVCHGLAYRSSRLSKVDRAHDKVRQLSAWLDCDDLKLGPEWRPKGMHRRTFHRLVAELEKAKRCELSRARRSRKFFLSGLYGVDEEEHAAAWLARFNARFPAFEDH